MSQDVADLVARPLAGRAIASGSEDRTALEALFRQFGVELLA
jgi:hypothetical protein